MSEPSGQKPPPGYWWDGEAWRPPYVASGAPGDEPEDDEPGVEPGAVDEQPEPAPAKKKPPGVGGALAAALILVIAVTVCNSNRDTATRPGVRAPDLPVAPATYEVVYEVTLRGGLQQADLTFANALGDTEQDTVQTPWVRTFRMSPGDFAYVSAQKPGERGTVTCTITIEGAVVSRADSDQAYGIAGCNSGVPS